MNWIINTWNGLSLLSKFLILFLLAWGIWELINYFRRKNAAESLSNEEFNENIRKAQVIDVREYDEFKAGHILGARSIPYTEIRQRYVELRDDQPIYLYEDGSLLAYKAAIVLKKKGFDDLYVLADGYQGWDGRIKRNRKPLN